MKTKVPPQPITNPVAKLFVLGVSSGLGLGLIPGAPGTYGSLLGIPLGFALLKVEMWQAGLACLAIFWIFSRLAQRACLHWGEMDAGRIVSDEVLGQAITLLGARSILASHPDSMWLWVGLGFLYFRICDIVKPFPARTFDHMKNGFGVVADDVVAGLYAALMLQLTAKIWLTEGL